MMQAIYSVPWYDARNCRFTNILVWDRPPTDPSLLFISRRIESRSACTMGIVDLETNTWLTVASLASVYQYLRANNWTIDTGLSNLSAQTLVGDKRLVCFVSPVDPTTVSLDKKNV